MKDILGAESVAGYSAVFIPSWTEKIKFFVTAMQKRPRKEIDYSFDKLPHIVRSFQSIHEQ